MEKKKQSKKATVETTEKSPIEAVVEEQMKGEEHSGVPFTKELLSKLEEVADEFVEFHETQKKKMEDILDTYNKKFKKLKNNVGQKTADHLIQITDRFQFATRSDLEAVLKKLNSIERKVEKLVKNS